MSQDLVRLLRMSMSVNFNAHLYRLIFLCPSVKTKYCRDTQKKHPSRQKLEGLHVELLCDTTRLKPPNRVAVTIDKGGAL